MSKACKRLREDAARLSAEVTRLTRENAMLRRQGEERDKLLAELLREDMLRQCQDAPHLYRTRELEWKLHPKWLHRLFTLFDAHSGHGFSFYVPSPEPSQDMLYGYPVNATTMGGRSPELVRKQ